MKRNTIILIFVLVAVIASAITAWYMLRPEKTQEPEAEAEVVEEQQPAAETGVLTTNDFSTNANAYFEDDIPPADPMIVGKWQNTDNPGWYKVYYDDYDEEEKLYWGKEWDETEDVQEEDLLYHGNGWFRWEKKGNQLCEYSTMDYRDVPIAKIYQIRHLSEDSISYFQEDFPKSELHFSKK